MEFLTAKEVQVKLKVSRSTLYRLVKEEQRFPKPVVMAGSGRRWYRHEIEMYMANLPREEKK